jgi:hypothetical protein
VVAASAPGSSPDPIFFFQSSPNDDQVGGKILEMSKPGRPPLSNDDPSTSVTIKVPSKDYDELYARSRIARVSVPEIIRRDLRQRKAEKRKAMRDGDE